MNLKCACDKTRFLRVYIILKTITDTYLTLRCRGGVTLVYLLKRIEKVIIYLYLYHLKSYLLIYITE